MRYSRGTASLLSTVFTFQARSVAAVDIFDQKSNEAGVDAGVLALAPSSSVTIASTCDADKIVTCVNGFDVNSPGGTTSCYDSCAGDCCFYGGSDACIGFTGKVCKDGSCSGAAACKNANIPLVVYSCKGYQACEIAGFGGGTIGIVNDSGNEDRDGFKAGFLSGSMGGMNDWCKGKRACYGLGSTSGKGGNDPKWGGAETLAGLPRPTISVMPDFCRTPRDNAGCSPFIFREP